MLPDDAQRPGAQYATDRYGAVFLLLVAALGFTTFVDESRLARTIASFALFIGVVGTLHSTGVTPRRLRIAVITASALVLVLVAGEATSSTGVTAAVTFALACALGFAAYTILRRIFEQTTIGVREVVAALTAYIEFAMVFAFTYMSVARASNEAFFTAGIAGQLSDFAYFSVVTITTLGYGDLTPATHLGRSLVMIETLFGQIFLVVLVAFLVGMLGHERSRD